MVAALRPGKPGGGPAGRLEQARGPAARPGGLGRPPSLGSAPAPPSAANRRWPSVALPGSAPGSASLTPPGGHSHVPVSSSSTSCSPGLYCLASETGPGAGGVPARLKKGLHLRLETVDIQVARTGPSGCNASSESCAARRGPGITVGVVAQADGHGEGAVPPWEPQLINVGGIEQLLDLQQRHPAAHLDWNTV